MPETPELFSEIANLRDQVDDMSRSVSAIARKSGWKDDILQAMENDPTLARVFLLVDGRRTQNDMVAELARTGPTVSQKTVSRKLDNLIQDWDLVRRTTRGKEGIQYVHTSLAADLRIVRALAKQPAKKAAARKLPPRKAPGG
ncbi:MAG: hypothetical protein ABI140_14775 [Jatrophihabitantaceae bacterium]